MAGRPYNRKQMGKQRFHALAAVACLVIAASLPAAARGRKERLVVQGRVALADGSLPGVLIEIDRVCNGASQFAGYADAEGRFRIDLGDASGASACLLRAKLLGYKCDVVKVASAGDGAGLGTLVLRWRAKSDAAARTTRNKDMLKTARKPYESGLDLAAKGKFHDAEDSFQYSIKLYPWASSPWLALGMLQEREGDLVSAKKSYKEAIRIEDAWLLPHFYAALIEVQRQEWQEAFEDAARLIQADPDAFPAAYFVSAWASLNLHNIDAAEKYAREGLALDSPHEYPELDYVFALALTDKGDKAGAIAHLKAYLALHPSGPTAQAAQAQLTELQASK